MDQDPIKQRYNELASKWLSGTITEAEKEELLNWYEQGHDKPAFIDPLYAKSRHEHERLLLTRIKQHTHPATMYSGCIRAAAAIEWK